MGAAAPAILFGRGIFEAEGPNNADLVETLVYDLVDSIVSVVPLAETVASDPLNSIVSVVPQPFV